MDSRRLSMYLSSATVLVAASVIVIVLTVSLETEGGAWIDLSRLRGALLLLSAVILAVSLYVLLKSRKSVRSADGSGAAGAAGAADVVQSDAASVVLADEAALEKLSDDERALYDMVREAGGQMLQMNIVASKVFSKAKVTRTLDKLEDRGLVVRERHGMTNRVRLIR